MKNSYNKIMNILHGNISLIKNKVGIRNNWEDINQTEEILGEKN